MQTSVQTRRSRPERERWGGRRRVAHPMYPTPVGYETLVVSDHPDTQVADTIQLMRRYAAEDARDPKISAIARQLAAGARDERAYVGRVWSHVREKIRFLDDASHAAPLGLGTSTTPVIEVLVRPRDIAGIAGVRHEDCDGSSMYAAALLHSAGIRCAFVTVAADVNDPRWFSHVYVAAYPRSGRVVERVPVDASHGPRCGWEVEQVGRRREWPVGPSPTFWLSLLTLGAVVAIASGGLRE